MKSEDWYNKNYKKLLLIPGILLALSIIYLSIFNVQHDGLFQRDISLTGGTTYTIFSEVSISSLNEFLEGKGLEFESRSLQNNFGEQTSLKITVGEDDDDIATPTIHERAWTVSQAMRTRALWLLIFAGSAQSLVGTGVMFQQVSIMSSKGLSSSAAAGVFAVFAPTAITGQFISGYLSGRVPARYLLAAGQMGIVVAVILLLNASELWQAYLYGAVLGITMGFLMNINQAIWPVYFGRRNLGSIRGVTNFGMMTSAAFGPLPLALALDITGSYTPGLIAYMVLPPLCGAAALFAGKPPTHRPVSEGRSPAPA